MVVRKKEILIQIAHGHAKFTLFFATTTEDHDSEKARRKDQSVQFGDVRSQSKSSPCKMYCRMHYYSSYQQSIRESQLKQGTR
jgi:hypothetical protein